MNYQLPQLQNVSVRVYDVLGKCVATVTDHKLEMSGRHSVQVKSATLPKGLYIIDVETERFRGTGKMMIAR